MLKLTYCHSCLHSLADPTRAKVIELLAQKSPQTVNSIVAKFPLRQPTISHHLKMLKKDGFVTSEKKGNQIWYSLNLACHKDESRGCYLLQKVAPSPLLSQPQAH
jgi:DNA-binding transcriptional ArsR family regulator